VTEETDHKIKEGFQRLILGRPEITDGKLTVSNICAEAGVSRASYYRSPQAAQIKRQLDTPQTPRPELQTLREQIKQLNKTEQALRHEHAVQVRALKDTIKTYANQIQALAMRMAQLEHDITRLAHDTSNITPLDTQRRTQPEPGPATPTGETRPTA
jgi:seryl-tRNA synthetase